MLDADASAPHNYATTLLVMKEKQPVARTEKLVAPAEVIEAAGRRFSPASRAKMSAAHKGKTLSPATRDKMSASRRGKKLSAEHRANIAAGQIGREFSPVTRALMKAKKVGEKNPFYNKKHSPTSRASISETRVSQHLSEMTEAERLRIRSIYAALPRGDDNRELLALRYGFGIYRCHSYTKIGLICGRSESWARNSLKRIEAGQLLPARGLQFELLDYSLQPFFEVGGRLTLSQLKKLADIVPKFDRQELLMAVSLFGLGGQAPQPVAEINRRLFQSAGWGEQRIRQFKQNLLLLLNDY